jgi:isoquinoline 1-oxidoreductase beta subunit
MNCTVSVAAGRVDAYGGFQNPPGALAVVADNLGVQPNDVYTHTTFLGGGFGRRSRNDEVRQAAAIAGITKKPTKMVWTREEDLRQGKHRPMAVTKLVAGIGADGMPTGLWMRSVQHSITAHTRPDAVVNGLDNGAVEGFRTNTYAIKDQYLDMHIRNSNLPVQAYRSVAVSQNIFQFESFIDEMAIAGGKDPLQFRQDLVKDLPDYSLVLKTLREKSGFATNLPKGTGMGVAMSTAFGTIAAQCATVTVTRRGVMSVDKVVAVFDTGHLVNPSIAEAQAQSAVTMGLGAAWLQEITMDKGQVVQGNFDTYPVMRMNQMPVIETHFALTGGDKWGGMGEPGLPPIAAAVGNAIFQATGKRVRSMPFTHSDLSWS